MSGDSRSAAGERVGENIEDPMATCTSDMEYFESYQDFDVIFGSSLYQSVINCFIHS